MARSVRLLALGALIALTPVATSAQTNSKTIGRIQYSVTPLAPLHVPFPHEYVRLRLAIKKFGEGGVLSTSDPNFIGQLFSGVFKKSRYAFVGVRFSNGPFELLQSPATTTATPAIPFFTILYAERGTDSVGPPHTDDNDVVLGPREVGSADVDLQISTAWGKKVKTSIPKAVWGAAQAASIAYSVLPAAMANAGLSTKLTADDRSAADKYFSDALSFDTKDQAANGPDGLNVIAISRDQLTTGALIDVSVYDRDASDDDRQLLVEFTLTTEYLPSVLPGTPAQPPQDLKSIFQGWDPNSNIVSGDAKTSVSDVLSLVPPDATYGSAAANMRADSGNFGIACTKLNSYFGQLGFNEYDQYALTWATLRQSDYLKTFPKLSRDNQAAAVAAQGGFNCPGSATNGLFATVGLAPIDPLKAVPAPAPIETAPPSNDMRKTLYKLAHDWANATADRMNGYTDPDQTNQFGITRDAGNVLGLAGDGPTSPAELAAAIAAHPSRLSAFGHSQSHPRDWCVTFTVASNPLKGIVRFNPTNAQIIDEIDFANSAADCAGQ